MTDNGDNMLKVVELFVDNINTLSQGQRRLEDRLDDVKDKVSTPPRNEELSGEHEKMSVKLEGVESKVDDLKDAVKSMILIVKVAVAVLGLAALISSAVVFIGNRSLVKQFNQQQSMELHELNMQ